METVLKSVGVCNTPLQKWAYAIRPYGNGRMQYATTEMGVCDKPLRYNNKYQAKMLYI